MSTTLIEDLPQLTIEDFRILIGQKAESKSKSIFKNGKPENANIVASNIFKYSSIVRIYAENMDGKISDCLPDYYSELINFIDKKDSRITIVLNKIEEKKSKALLYLTDSEKRNPDKIKIYKASVEFQNAVKKYKVGDSNDLLFITGDTDKFRLEHDKSSTSAYFSFNNSEITKTLINVFDGHLASCTAAI